MGERDILREARCENGTILLQIQYQVVHGVYSAIPQARDSYFADGTADPLTNMSSYKKVGYVGVVGEFQE